MDSKALREATNATIVLQVSLQTICPALSPLIGTIGVQGALALMMALGGKKVRIPRIEEVVRAMDVVNAVLAVRKGLSEEQASYKFRVNILRLRSLVKNVAPHLDKLDAARKRQPPVSRIRLKRGRVVQLDA